MSWFEQGTSNPRRVIMQFHRPAKLKLKRTAMGFSPACSLPDTRDFYFQRKAGGVLWIINEDTIE
ncbi:MAG: hypothetical protein KHW59_07520 [Clostridiales bacterium]|nr:hypothetical protein [Clostridiales bacterium]